MTNGTVVNAIQNRISHKLYNAMLAVAVICLLVGAPFGTAFAAKAEAKKPVAEMPAAKVNINKADAATIAEVLNGVGLTKAEAIVAYRKANGKFKSAEELTAVKGIGESTIAKNKAKIVL